MAYYRKAGNIIDGCFLGVSILGWGATLFTHWLSSMRVHSLHEKMRLHVDLLDRVQSELAISNTVLILSLTSTVPSSSLSDRAMSDERSCGLECIEAFALTMGQMGATHVYPLPMQQALPGLPVHMLCSGGGVGRLEAARGHHLHMYRGRQLSIPFLM